MLDFRGLGQRAFESWVRPAGVAVLDATAAAHAALFEGDGPRGHATFLGKSVAAAAVVLLVATLGADVILARPGHTQTTSPRMSALASSAPERKAEPVTPGGPPPPMLQARIEEMAKKFQEPVGIAVSEVGSDWIAQVRGGEIFPQQSVSKTWVVLSVLDAADKGRLRLDQPVVMRAEDRSVFYQPIIRKIGRNGYDTSIGELLNRAITDSDNAANDKLISLVGGPSVVSQMLNAKGLGGIRVGFQERVLQAQICGLTWSNAIAGWKFKEVRATVPEDVRNQAAERYLADPADGATPVGIVRALSALKSGKLLSVANTNLMLQTMQEVRTGTRRLKGGLPEGWTIAHKTGTGQDWSGGSMGINDIALLTAPDGHSYAVAVMIRRTKAPLSRRMGFMQQVTRTVVEAWEAEHGRNA